MPVFHTLKDGIVIVTVDGDYTSPELKRAGARALEDPGVDGKARVLLDMSGAAGMAKRSQEELRETAHLFSSMGGDVEAVAILAPDDLSFGLMRVGLAYYTASGERAEIFRERAQALAWLGDPAAAAPD
jgi:hypothetical protein